MATATQPATQPRSRRTAASQVPQVPYTPPALAPVATPSAAPANLEKLEAHLLNKYGPVIGTDALAELLSFKYSHGKAVCNAISRELFPIPTTRAAGRRVAYYTDVAAYLASLKPQA